MLAQVLRMAEGPTIPATFIFSSLAFLNVSGVRLQLFLDLWTTCASKYVV